MVYTKLHQFGWVIFIQQFTPVLLLTIISATMKHFLLEFTSTFHQSCQHRLNRANTMPSADNIHHMNKTKITSSILTFQKDAYPFLNSENSSFFMFKTLVNLPPNHDKLERVINLCHPNIIGVKKIVKNRGKQGQPVDNQIYYSFYYETVQYGLKNISDDPHNTAKFYTIILSIDLIKVVSQVIEYLQERGIYYGIRKEDIGIDKQGSIKIYIPPYILFDSNYDTSTTQQAFAKLADWWISVQDNCHRQMFKKDIQLGKIKQSQKLKSARITESIIYNEQNEANTHNKHLHIIKTEQSQQKLNTNKSNQQLTKQGELRLERINKIQKETKLIREKIIEQTKQEEKKTLLKSNPGLYNQKSIPILPKYSNHQQNIIAKQTINYINAPNPKPNFPNSGNNLIPRPPNLSKNNNHLTFFGEHDDSAEYLEDMQFGPQYQSPRNNTKNIFGNTFNLAKQPSKREFKYSRQLSGNNLCQKQNKNQLVCHKKFTESAGPRKFQSIINKCKQITKQPNIYEVTCENENSTKIKQRNKTNIIVGDKSALIDSAGQCIEITTKTMATSNQLSNNDSHLNNEKIKVIESKIKKVLEKTKDAIGLLNGVKNKPEKQTNKMHAKSNTVYF